MKDLIIFGASYPDLIKLIHSINRVKETWKVIGFLDDVKYGRDSEFMGYPILGNRRNIDGYNEEGTCFVNNVFGTTKNREKVSLMLEEKDVRFATLVAPDVDCSFAEIGRDVIIMPGVKIGSGVFIDDHVGIRLNCIINHDNKLARNVFVGPGAVTCGYVNILEGAYIGAGSVIKERLTIGKWAIVGSGASVIQEVPDGDIVAGNPAVSIKKKDG